ncbi:uncharacterized protein LOC130621566 [Hydractinia symbiolongicarpus]|uniref:uncharacterized protein LOC130621566 n=1 Tax=Hydractinia symbiolongicarpus TaxID=13093 RepID=UPI00254E22CA|nr:uncharacterized protein LOC130621566 [Hydractinia symbiolongicarpus]
MSWLKNAITKLYSAVSAPVAATRDALAGRLQSVRDTVRHYYNRAREQIAGRTTLHDEIEREAREDFYDAGDIQDEYSGVEDIKHMFPQEKNRSEGVEDIQHIFDENDTQMLEDGNRVKTWRFNKNLNQPLAEAIIQKITPYIDMRVKVVYSFACIIYEAGGGTAPYHKTKGSEGSLTSLADIEAFIEKCEMQRLDLGDNEFWGKAYLPPERTIEIPGSYEGKIVFQHVQIKIISTREPLLGCGPLPDWLRKKRCIYAVDGKEERMRTTYVSGDV